MAGALPGLSGVATGAAGAVCGSSPRVVRRRCPIASTAARASARAAPVSPVGITSRGAERRSASAAIASVRAFNAATTASISRPRVAQAVVDALVEPAAERLLAVAELVLARLHLRRFFFERRALARRQPALVLERLDVALDLRQVLGQLRLADAAVLARARR